MVSRHPGGRPRQLKRSPIGSKIESLAAGRGLHLDQLADAAGIRLPTLNRIITGRIASPRIDTVSAIARALRVNIDRLVQ